MRRSKRSEVEIRRADEADFAGGLAPVMHYFGHSPDDGTAERLARLLPADRMHVAREDGAIVAGASAFAFDLTVPGGTLPAGGVTVVGVLPTHRRRGILTQLMRAQLEDLHERGEPLACLWASEGGIYERFGYGMAALCGEIDLKRAHARFRREPAHGGSFRLLGAEEALEAIPPVYARVAAETPGMFARTRLWWETRVLRDSEDRREGAGEMARVVLERDGVAQAYALYRLKLEFEAGSSAGELRVIEAMGLSPEATAGIWRFLLDIDWMERMQAELLPVDHPLFLLLEDPRRMRFRIWDSLWVRLVDVSAALAGRSRAGDGDVVLEVRDAFCPWNEGRFSANGTRTAADAELRLDVADLGSVYLGGFAFAELERAGRVEEVVEGAVARADALFRSDRAPWCPEIF
jgi:predicted acetyltransferase